MRINDARGREQDFTLDDNGFQFARLNSNVTDFTDKDYVKTHYYPEVEELVKRMYVVTIHGLVPMTNHPVFFGH